MTARYKNKRICRAVYPGIFLAAAGLLWGIRDVSAGTEVKVGTITAGGVFFYDTEIERNIYLTRNLYFKYGYTSNGVTQGGVTAVLDGAAYHAYEDRYEIGPVIKPGVYNFHLTYSVPGTQKSDPIYWYAWIGYSNYYNYQFSVYIYDVRLPYVKISYGQTINGTITVSDVGQTRKLEKVAETDNQVYLVGRMLPKPLKVKITGSGEIIKKDIPVSFSVTPATANYSFSETGTVKTITVNTIADGTASVPFRLGTVSERYSIKAVCDSCSAGKEVTFTARAVTKEQVTELQLKWCDFAGTVDRPLQNPIKVKAFNKLSGEGVSDLNVLFSVVDAPSPLYDLNPETTKTTQPYGLTKTIFTLGPSYGQYNVRAVCDNCLVKKEVFCPVTAGPQKNIPKERSKVNPDSQITVRFIPASFNVVYGKAVDVCAIVDPPDKAGSISFASAKGGFSTTVNPTPTIGCDGPGKISVHILSKINACILQDSVLALIDGVQPVAEAAGNVLLPNSEYAVKKISNSSDCVLMGLSPLCKYEAYNILFTPSINMQGLTAKERLINRRILRNLSPCSDSLAIETQFEVDELNGQFGFADIIGFNRLVNIPTNCGYQFDQRVYIGACPIQTNSITVEFDGAGNIITTRTDQQ